jgi:hypothetical protein
LSRRRLALSFAAVLVSTASAVGIGLRSFYADPRYGGDDPTLHRLVNELEPHPGDAVILNDAAYRYFFMNYYTAREPIYVMPDAPGERSEPGKPPAARTVTTINARNVWERAISMLHLLLRCRLIIGDPAKASASRPGCQSH